MTLVQEVLKRCVAHPASFLLGTGEAFPLGRVAGVESGAQILRVRLTETSQPSHILNLTIQKQLIYLYGLVMR